MGALEQKIKDSEEQKKEPWQLQTKDFIPIHGIFTQLNRMQDHHFTKKLEKGGISLKSLASNYFHYLPRGVAIIFYNVAVAEAVTYAGYRLYQAL